MPSADEPVMSGVVTIESGVMHKQIDTVLVIEEDGNDIALSTGGKWQFFDDLKARIRKDASQYR